ncbi:MAG TPA: hypothetical protein ENI96_10090 [Sedimenticola thiotaurini]|uniref:Uncharacterized protein n=1 Tax=Sedimenticola thiotaurini TaxID=1543721 RepID=A0A831RPT6_9GAMM|nr:hypothetical protein [Sedimenticola thiotaurini]
MSKKLLIYLFLLTAVLTWLLYNYNRSRGPDQERIDYCNELVRDMPERNRQEIDRAILRFNECLGN